MSIIPGPEAWRDAGLAAVDPAALVEIADDPNAVPLHPPTSTRPAETGSAR